MSRFERFETTKVSRKDIKNADYNPRTISNAARARLRAGIEKMGLVQPLVWNKRSGNLVGGHQRISILDDLEGNAEYQLTVAVVDVGPSEERRLNVLLNNDSSMGHWDERKLLDLFQAEEEGLDYEAFGFSAQQGEYFTNLIEASELENAGIADALSDIIDLQEDIEDEGDVDEKHETKMERKRAYEEQVSKLLTSQTPDEWKLKTPEEKKAYDDARNGYKNESFGYAHLKIVFASPEGKMAFLERHNLPKNSEVIHESDLIEAGISGGEGGAG